MMRSLGSRDRRALRIGLFFTVPLMLAIFVIRPLYSAHSDLREALARERALLGREVATLAAAAELRKALRQRGAAFGTARAATLEGPGPVAGAALSRRLVHVAEDAGLRVGSAQSRDVPEGGEPPGLAHVDMVATGDWRSVTDFMRALAEQPKYLRVSSFSLSRSGTMPGEARTALQVEARVVGLIMPDLDGATSSRDGAR